MSASWGLLSKHRSTYIKYYLYNLLTTLWALPFVLLVAFWKGADSILSRSAFVLFVISFVVHVIHTAFAAAVNIMHFRYYIVTFTPLLFAMGMLCLDRLLAVNRSE
jgi:uncharacterized protein with PQ loop repeat